MHTDFAGLFLFPIQDAPIPALSSTIVQSNERLCTMLRHRKYPKIDDFALPKGTIVHPIH